MPENTHPLKATIVGAGPVGCLVAIELRRRSVHVDLYERETDLRRTGRPRGHFNVTLTRRGLDCLDEELVWLLSGNGVRLPQRVIHDVDGSLFYQQYGSGPEHHVLSIPRGTLHHTLLDLAEDAGARLFFGHECVSADPERARATFTVDGTTLCEATADLLIGCDGANSVIRHEMSRRGARMRVSEEHLADGFVELTMPPAADGEHALLKALQDENLPESSNHGLHIWPRRDFMLLAQPNVDKTYTTSLFLPGERCDQPSWESVRTPDDVAALFSRHFRGVGGFLPDLMTDVLAATPTFLKTVTASPYHHERTVLVGDAAQALPPLHGLGINYAFEDVKTFFDIFDQHVGEADRDAGVRKALAHFTEARKPEADAVAELSLAMRAELQGYSYARAHLESQLCLHHPDDFTPLHHMVALPDMSYDEIVSRHERQRDVVDELCRRFDINTEVDKIVASYAADDGGTAGAIEPVRDAVAPVAAVPSSSDLEMAPEELKDLLDAVAGRLLRYQEGLANGQYPASYPPAETASATKAHPREHEVPELGTDLDGLLDDIFERVITNGAVHPHPGFMADVPSGGLFQAAVGDFIARTLNRFPGSWTSAPGLAQIESNVIKWFCGMLGYGDRAFGYLTTSGSLANLMALRCSLEQVGDVARQRATIYVSSQGHFSVEKAARIAGLSKVQVRVIDTYPGEYSMNVEELRERVDRDRREGFFPACVVATAGTANTGAIDDLTKLDDYCRAQNIWLHVDACFGGFFRITGRGKDMLDGIERADSIAVDAHKSLFLPYGTSALLVREPARLRAAFEVPGTAYVPDLVNADEQVDFCNYGPEFTREVRGLTAWLPIKMHGIKAFEQCLDEKLDLAAHLAESLLEIDGMDVVGRSSPHLPTVAFKLRSDSRIEEERLNERLCEHICSRGNVFLGTVRLPQEGLVIRACILHHQTNKVIVDQLVEDIRSSVAAVR